MSASAGVHGLAATGYNGPNQPRPPGKQKIGAVRASAVTYLPPIIAFLIGVALAGKPVTVLDVVAMVAILVGVGFIQSGRSSVAPASRKPA